MRILFFNIIAVGCSPASKDTATPAITEDESWKILFESGPEERWLFEAGAIEIASNWHLSFEGQWQLVDAPAVVNWTIFAGAPLSNEGEILQEGSLSGDVPKFATEVELPECSDPPCGVSLITKWIADSPNAASITLTVAPSSQEMAGLSVAATRLQ